MKKRYLIALIVSLIITGLTYKFWLIFKTATSARFDFYPFCIILILSYLGGLKLTDYLADFKDIKHQSRIEIAFLSAFFILLFIPMSHINTAEKSEQENRMLAVYKPLITSEYKINYNFGNDFDKWYSDRFNFREKYIKLYSYINLTAANHTDTAKVLYGKDGWLFYKGEASSIHSYQNTNLFSPNELETVAQNLEKINQYCKQHNKAFYFIIAPDKSKIYGEYYNPNIRKVNPDSKSKARQLLAYLHNNTDIKTIYPDEILLSNKNKNLLYYKRDTHWNPLGAYYGYSKLIDAIKKDYPKISKYKFSNYVTEDYFGDLHEMLPDNLKQKEPDKYQVPDSSKMNHKCLSTEKATDIQHCINKNGKYNLTMFRDSFASALIPYLGETFQNSTYIWDYNVDLNMAQNSDIVIFEIVERSVKALRSINVKGGELIMLFSSMTFIFMFLPILCTVYLLCKKEYHNAILLIASLIFYAWGEPKYLAIILLCIIANWAGAILIDKFQTKPNIKKLILVATIGLNLGNLIVFKYLNFILDNINSIFHGNIHLIEIIMPLGISFYTFQALSYIIDVYRGECKVQKNIYKLALFICLFPQLIAGPIVKYHDIEDQINSREVNFDKVCLGVKRFIIGLSKKILIANTMGAIADKIFTQDPHNFSHSIAWIGSFAYSLQLYFDFSGYSDMAIGLGLIFGFRFMENFNYPYISKSITEFWRRWHISLSTWFKQYVYISLGGNRAGKIKTLRNLGIVFLLTGIWHGAEWTFVIWGIWHGLFIILEKILNIKEFENKPHSLCVNILRHIYCILIFSIGWVMFRADNIKYAWDYIMNMLGLLHLRPDEFLYELPYYISPFEIIIFVIAILCSIPLFKNMLNIKNKFVTALINVWLLALFVISSAAIAASTYNPFIYFRF